MKKFFKSLLVLFAAAGLAGCSFADVKGKINSLIHKEESSEVQKEEQKPSEEKPSEEKPSGEEEQKPEADPVLVSIAVSGQFKTEYEVGEEFSSEGIIVTAHFDKGEDKDVSSEASFSGFDSSVAGECVVTVSFEGKETSFVISIVEPQVAVHSIEEIVADIESSFGISFTEDNGEYFAGFYRAASSADAETYPDNADENTLLSIANFVYSYCPEYLVISNYHFYDGVVTSEMADEEKKEHDFWGDEDGSTALEVYLLNEDSSIFIDIIAYCYNGYPCFGIDIYSLI